ncbi:hypothetical protein ABID21_000168 [Pseudorhizobium tarimense]|uniref:Uncharacterized protein n=1 Tax=Pseudorhizobium tarimense TaxID=1079109 RepID=A0ABV2H0L2_9HYPH|nr:hypothetical protein [Pseudorhizobium tarimense]MCJ8517410.1 hypothetical protein [Pseudorhizobium tarimense]
MSDQRNFFPEILSSEEIGLMHATVHDLLGEKGAHRPARDPQDVARLVLRLYRIGLTEPPRKLRDLAGMMADRETMARRVS